MMLVKGHFLINPVIFFLCLIFLISSVNHVGLPEFSVDLDSPDRLQTGRSHLMEEDQEKDLFLLQQRILLQMTQNSYVRQGDKSCVVYSCIEL